MNKLITLVFLCLMFTNLQAQIKVYNKQGTKMVCVAEDFDIFFEESSVKIPETPKEGIQEGKSLDGAEIGVATAALLSAVIPPVIDAGFKFVDSLLAKNIRQYVAEYEHGKSYLYASSRKMPDFTVERLVWQTGDSDIGDIALKIAFKAYAIPNLPGAMVYYIDAFELNYTKAKIKKNDRPDYSINITPVFLDKNGNITTALIEPLKIRSVKFGNDTLISKDFKYRTDIFFLPQDAFLTKISVKIIETNPRKISAEQVFANWKEYRPEVKNVTDATAKQVMTAITDAAEHEEQWKIAEAKNTKTSYQTFLEKYPIGKYSNKAREKIKEFENKSIDDREKDTSIGND